MKQLIKDETIKEILKNWCIYNQIGQVVCHIGDYDHGGFCAYQSVVEFDGIDYRIGIQFERKRSLINLKDGQVYSLGELIQ